MKASEVQVELGFPGPRYPNTLSSSASSTLSFQSQLHRLCHPCQLGLPLLPGQQPCSTSMRMALSMVK